MITLNHEIIHLGKHLRSVVFNHPPSAIKTCSCGETVSRGHFLQCSLSSFDDPLADRLDPRTFWHSYQLLENRKSQLEPSGSARGHQTGQAIPPQRAPYSPLRMTSQSRSMHTPNNGESDSERFSLDIPHISHSPLLTHFLFFLFPASPPFPTPLIYLADMHRLFPLVFFPRAHSLD